MLVVSVQTKWVYNSWFPIKLFLEFNSSTSLPTILFLEMNNNISIESSSFPLTSSSNAFSSTLDINSSFHIQSDPTWNLDRIDQNVLSPSNIFSLLYSISSKFYSTIFSIKYFLFLSKIQHTIIYVNVVLSLTYWRFLFLMAIELIIISFMGKV
jgi:hypothetical protein